AIGLQVTLLERKLHSAEVNYDVFQPILTAVRSELRRIHAVNSEIMDFAKPIVINCEPCDIKTMLTELKQTHSAALDSANIQFNIHVNSDSVLWLDPDRINQVLVNLFNNAVDSLPENGGVITVEVDRVNGCGNVITFSDNGN